MADRRNAPGKGPLAALALLLTCIASPGPVWAADGEPVFGGPEHADEDNEVSADVSAETDEDEPAAVTPVDSGPDDGRVWVGLPQLGSHDGQPCLDYSWVRLDPSEVDQAREDARSAIEGLQRTLPESGELDYDRSCPVDDSSVLSPQLVGDLVEDTVTDALPRPEPSVPPGWALTGMPAYLVTDHQLEYGPARHPVDLEIMQVTVEVTGQATTTVDWGDGSAPRTYEQPGQPYPDGSIVHTYADAGTASIEITDTWELTYDLYHEGDHLLTDTITLDLAPVTLDDLDIRELRTVRTSNR